MIKVKGVYISPKAKEVYEKHGGIKFAKEGDVCMDLRSVEFIRYCQGELVMVPLGVALEMDDTVAAYLYSRSSIPKKKGLVIANGVGIIDSRYRDELKIVFYAIKDGEIQEGERVAQIEFRQKDEWEYETVDRINRDNDRKGGFGSSGSY